MQPYRSLAWATDAALRPDGHFRAALATHRAGDLPAAALLYEAIVEASPGGAEIHYALAIALAGLGRQQDAGAAWDRAQALPVRLPDDAVAVAMILVDAKAWENAARLLAHASHCHPRDARVLALNGRVLRECGRPQAAIGAFYLALECGPHSADAHHDLAATLFDAGDMDQALVHASAAFDLAPTGPHAVTLAAAYVHLGRYQDSFVLGERMLQSVAMFEAQLTYAMALAGVGRLAQAEAAARRAVALSPDRPIGRFNLAVILLQQGAWTREAWDLFDSRLALRRAPPWLANCRAWRGEDIAGGTILLHAEQGQGDTIQFVRYAPLVAARAGRVILAVQPSLRRLLKAVPGVDLVVGLGEALPPHDVICPLMSLPGIFGTTAHDVPPALPYCDNSFAVPQGDDACLRVGLVWAGSSSFVHDRLRTIPAEALARLRRIAGVQYYSLQHDARRFPPLPGELGAIDLMGRVDDFADTAALVAGLDLIVSVDTAVAHLAASMGKPVWLLSRSLGCWRWVHGAPVTPWYPSMRIFQQTQDGWQGALDRVSDALTQVVEYAARHAEEAALGG